MKFVTISSDLTPVVATVHPSPAAGRIEAPDSVTAGYLYSVGQGGSAVFTAPPTPAPTGEDVNAERDRRLTLCPGMTPTGYGSEIIPQTRPEDRDNLQDLNTEARLRIASLDLSPILFRDADNGMHALSAAQIVELIEHIASYQADVWAAAWAIKDDAGGIQSNYETDSRWPTSREEGA